VTSMQVMIECPGTSYATRVAAECSNRALCRGEAGCPKPEMRMPASMQAADPPPPTSKLSAYPDFTIRVLDLPYGKTLSPIQCAPSCCPAIGLQTPLFLLFS